MFELGDGVHEIALLDGALKVFGGGAGVAVAEEKNKKKENVTERKKESGGEKIRTNDVILQDVFW